MVLFKRDNLLFQVTYMSFASENHQITKINDNNAYSFMLPIHMTASVNRANPETLNRISTCRTMNFTQNQSIYQRYRSRQGNILCLSEAINLCCIF